MSAVTFECPICKKVNDDPNDAKLHYCKDCDEFFPQSVPRSKPKKIAPTKFKLTISARKLGWKAPGGVKQPKHRLQFNIETKKKDITPEDLNHLVVEVLEIAQPTLEIIIEGVRMPTKWASRPGSTPPNQNPVYNNVLPLPVQSVQPAPKIEVTYTI
jgi:hypothetical protein